MPAWLKSKDEPEWEKAKEAASKTLSQKDGDSYWALVNSIFQKMKKTEIIEKSLRSIKDLLSKASDEEGMHEVPMDENDISADDEDNIEDHKSISELKANPNSRHRVKWTPPSDYKPDELSAIKDLVGRGYSMREANRIVRNDDSSHLHGEADTNAGPTRTPFEKAALSGISPDLPSNKMLEDLKPHAAKFLQNYKRQQYEGSDPSQNPNRYAAGQMLNAGDIASKSFDDHMKELKNNPDYSNMSSKDKRVAERNLKLKYLESENNTTADSALHSAAKSKDLSNQARGMQTLENIQSYLTDNPESQMSAAEVAQHMAPGKTDEEGGQWGSVKTDPTALVDIQHSPQLKEHLAKLKTKYGNHPDIHSIMNNLEAVRVQKMAQKSTMRRPSNQQMSPDKHINHIFGEWAPVIRNTAVRHARLAGIQDQGAVEDMIHDAGLHSLVSTLHDFSPAMAEGRAKQVGEADVGKHSLKTFKALLRDKMMGTLKSQHHEQKMKDMLSSKSQKQTMVKPTDAPVQAPVVDPAKAPSAVKRFNPEQLKAMQAEMEKQGRTKIAPKVDAAPEDKLPNEGR